MIDATQRDQLLNASRLLEQATDIIESIANTESAKFKNLPDLAKQSVSGQRDEQVVSALHDLVGTLCEVIQEVDGLSGDAGLS